MLLIENQSAYGPSYFFRFKKAVRGGVAEAEDAMPFKGIVF